MSWNDQTRAVIDARCGIDPDFHQFCDEAEWKTLRSLCDHIIPQPLDRPVKAPIAAIIDQKLYGGKGDGYRDAHLPEQDKAWRLGLAAVDAEAMAACEKPFCELSADQQHWLLGKIQRGQASSEAWQDMPPAIFFAKRLLHDIVSAYYAHPASWNEIGFGGPASPRGYVRMNFDRRDPWEAAEASPGREDQARVENERVG
ncbi:gluconate 2-dehydrogenase subunit 3 family protein [Bradyrhizobium macuxiense]|uniref:gluconate 2-dehydrogenase subunit 3 family protein n=1 Tax=Bradyrhizobium macuxiense TaxID=1755647 RepID=UPI001FD93EC8|nr:gluconate 2-dehydrogenase subunit 3 family protein [Bradyrhizobium macuxiense]